MNKASTWLAINSIVLVDTTTTFDSRPYSVMAISGLHRQTTWTYSTQARKEREPESRIGRWKVFRWEAWSHVSEEKRTHWSFKSTRNHVNGIETPGGSLVEFERPSAYYHSSQIFPPHTFWWFIGSWPLTTASDVLKMTATWRTKEEKPVYLPRYFKKFQGSTESVQMRKGLKLKVSST